MSSLAIQLSFRTFTRQSRTDNPLISPTGTTIVLYQPFSQRFITTTAQLTQDGERTRLFRCWCKTSPTVGSHKHQSQEEHRLHQPGTQRTTSLEAQQDGFVKVDVEER